MTDQAFDLMVANENRPKWEMPLMGILYMVFLILLACSPAIVWAVYRAVF